MADEYVIYLRKSRVDIEYGMSETLLRHEAILMELAKKRSLNVAAIYKEIVSGDTIASRPVMQQLLSEVEKGKWNGVIVMEVERLARGDTIDQGIVAQTFKYSETQIITPAKTYNPSNEFDEEYFEFGLFMSRREYKTINRRLQQGRIASVKEGNYIGSIAPYGYSKVKQDRHFTLEIDVKEAEIVRRIFDLYVTGFEGERMGVSKIVNYLNKINIPTRHGEPWNTGTVRDIINNPVYIGKIRWNERKTVKNMSDGNLVSSRPRNTTDVLIVDGVHKPIISEEIFNQAQRIKKIHGISPSKTTETIQNPLSGLVVCAKCGHKMVRRPYKNEKHQLICHYTYCNNVSSELSIVEKRIMETIQNWIDEYKVNIYKETEQSEKYGLENESIHKALQKEIVDLNKQLEKVYDLLERGVYDTDTFFERSENIKKRVDELKREDDKIKNAINEKIKSDRAKIDIIPKVEKVIKTYYLTDSYAEKNNLLKQIIEKITYSKEKSGRWGNPEDFEIQIYFLLPKQE